MCEFIFINKKIWICRKIFRVIYVYQNIDSDSYLFVTTIKYVF